MIGSSNSSLNTAVTMVSRLAHSAFSDAHTQRCFISDARGAFTGWTNHFMMRLARDGRILLLGLMGRERAVHLWRPSDEAHAALVAGRPADSAQEERITAPLAPLCFSDQMDGSLSLKYEHMMRGPRDFLLVHLPDARQGPPIHLLLCLHRDQADGAPVDFLTAEARRKSVFGGGARRRGSDETSAARFAMQASRAEVSAEGVEQPAIM